MKTVKETLISWFQNAAVERLAYIAIGIVVVLVITALIKRVVNNKIVNTDHRYRVRKAVNFIGYLLILLISPLYPPVEAEDQENNACNHQKRKR